MIKLLLSLILAIGILFPANAQYDFHKIDVSVAVLAPVLGYGLLNVDYSLTDSKSVGIQITKDFNEVKENDDFGYGDLSISAHLRTYPADNEAKGFFWETFAKYKKNDARKYEGDLQGEDVNLLGLGVGAGYKKVTSFGFLFGLNLSVGYGLNISGKGGDVMGRGALFAGWRF